MATTWARPVPIKGADYRVYFPILDADGDLVSGATGLDSERSLDGATFADCTNEAIEVATASGMYYLELTAAEMTADAVCVIVKTTSSGAKTTPIVLYPQEAGDIKVAVQSVDTDGTVGVVRGTVSTSSSTVSITTSAITPSITTVANQFKGRIVTFDAATTTAGLRGQATDITSHTSGTTPTLAVTALTTTPASGDTFSIT